MKKTLLVLIVCINPLFAHASEWPCMALIGEGDAADKKRFDIQAVSKEEANTKAWEQIKVWYPNKTIQWVKCEL